MHREFSVAALRCPSSSYKWLTGAQDKKAKGSISVADILRVSPSMDTKHTLAFRVETAGSSHHIIIL